MKKELPKIFQNKISKDSNVRVKYSKYEEKYDKDININQKIQTIFNNMNYVYKMDTIITLSTEIKTVTIVGRNKDSLITIDGEIIPIKDIKDIEIK